MNSTNYVVAIKPICTKNKVRRDGTSIIFIQYCDRNGKATLLNTGIAIPPNCWNRKYLRISSELPEMYGSVEQLSKRLADLIRKTEDIISHAVKEKLPDISSFLKLTFHPDFNILNLKISGTACFTRSKESLIIGW